MTAVRNFVREVDGQVWHRMETIAFRYPNGSRFLAIPIAFGTFVRDTIAIPAECLEELILTSKAVKAYLTEGDADKICGRKIDVGTHLFYAIKYAVQTPFSPLVGLIDAVISFIKVGASPFKTAKINASKQDFSLFLEEGKYSSSARYLANKVEFAWSAFNRFQQKIHSAQSNEEIDGLFFVDEGTSKMQIESEIAAKKARFQEAKGVYMKSYKQIHEADRTKLDKAWKEFQNQLIKATPTEAVTLTFSWPDECA